MTDRKKVLIVDDEESMVALLKKRIESAEYDVITAFDGQEGLSVARKEKPDLIVTDVMMPRLDGYHMCRLLKFDDNFKDIPIIMLTARTGTQDKANSLQVGADEYLTKPFDGKDVVASIDKHLKNENEPI